jgi:serine/threonine protein kinase
VAAISKLARYRDISRLGSGGTATVVLAEDMTLGRLVALKRVNTLWDASARSRMRREALVGASLSHPNLVSIYDVFAAEDDEQVIVMEYVAGETLRDALRGGSGLAVAEGLRVIEGVSAALDAIHRRGIVHRDVKPANILLGADGAIKLADLGIASAADRTRITADGAVLGTFSYMAPEQLDGARPTAAVDVYALATVAFEVLSGRKARLEANPFALAHAISTQPPPDLSEVWPQAPRAAVELLVRGMSREPSQRPRSAGELAGRLRGALERHATAPMPVPAGVLAPTGFSSARAPMSRRGSAPAPEAPRESRGSSYEDDAAAVVGVEHEKRRDGGGSAVLRDGRADAGPARQSPGSEPSAGRRGTPSPPVMTAGVGASSARWSGAVVAAAPEAAAKPSTDRRAREGGLMPANAARTLVASRRGGRSRGRILGAASIALVAAAVVVTVAVSGVGSPARTPSGATANRRSSAVSGPSRTTAKTSGALKAPASRVAATGASAEPANSVAATGASAAPANSVAATGASAAPANSVAATGASAAPAKSAAATGASSPPTQRPAHSVAATGASSAPTNSAAATGASSPPASTSASPSANAPAGSPVSAVESFYGLAASHRYAEAWALADLTFRNQLDGYQSFQAGLADDRSITFDAARVLSRSSGDATVAVQTTSVRTDGAQNCLGTVDLVSGSAPGGWLLHLIHINCT